MTAMLTPPGHAPAEAHEAPPRRRRPSGRALSVVALLAGTAVAYLWTLSESGYANSFYSAAAQAGSESWKAWFFGSLDSGNAITVDKPPAALWIMGLSVRIFGLSSWSILVPEALLGVATVGLVYATVRRTSGHTAAIAAGAVTALTPSAALMFRFNNPDALLLFLLVAAGYAMTRALETVRTRWLVLAGALVGFGFLAKMLQAFLVLPAFALVYLVAAPTPVRRRLWQLVVAFVSVLASAGWWVAIVELVPESWRPYIDGSTTNSILELAFGYNGLGRITGDETGGLGNGGFSSGVGILRLFGGVSGGMVTWILPAALALLVAGVAFRGRAPRTDRVRALLLMNGLAMITTGLVFSFMGGIYHDYYTVALAPWIAMTAVMGFAEVWRHRASLVARVVLVVATLGSAAWAWVLLGQADGQPWATLRWVVLVAGIAAAPLLLLVHRSSRAILGGALGLVVLTGITGPAAYSVDTINTAHTGSIVTAGPVSSRGGFGGGGGPGGGRGGFGGQGGPGQQSNQNGQQNGQGGPGGQMGQPPSQNGQSNQNGQGNQMGQPPSQNGQSNGQGGPSRMGDGGGNRGGGGGAFGGTSVSSEMKALLTDGADGYRWVAATVGATNAASYQLATEEPVMALGGFNGTTSSITLAQFEEYVADGDIHYYIASSGLGGGRGGNSAISEITSWVEENFTATTVGSTTVYDLTQTPSGGDSSGTNA
ncbi:MAG: glycosyltransferase family 39 protein [Nocardioides sp.]|uniref:ArnT family glycosyltransferase n=1 Tax=Nocardioides sp. TaxID=35761 RepID=UPI0039E500B1